MAAAPIPDPGQQAAPAPGADNTQPQGGGSPSQAPAPPELMALARVAQLLKGLAQQVPAASAGLAKATAGVNEAMSAIVSQPQQQTPQQSPPF
jgi:hypothetical protein